MVTNDNAEEVTIVARGADAVGSLHRYVTIIDSNDAVYLVGFGDATDNGYLTSDGQWGNGRDLPESMEFGSVMAAYYNDNTEGTDNLALLPTLAGVGVTFEASRLVRVPGDAETVLFAPGFSCVDGIMHVLNGSTDLGYVHDDDTVFDVGSDSVVGCDGGPVLTFPAGQWMETYSLSCLYRVDASFTALQLAWNTLILILMGRINYTWPST